MCKPWGGGTLEGGWKYCCKLVLSQGRKSSINFVCVSSLSSEVVVVEGEFRGYFLTKSAMTGIRIARIHTADFARETEEELSVVGFRSFLLRAIFGVWRWDRESVCKVNEDVAIECDV